MRARVRPRRSRNVLVLLSVAGASSLMSGSCGSDSGSGSAPGGGTGASTSGGDAALGGSAGNHDGSVTGGTSGDAAGSSGADAADAAGAAGGSGGGTGGVVGDADAGLDSSTVWPSTLNYKSGSRLRAVVWDTQDGTRAFRYWRDTQLNADCDFQLATDGVMRCLPRAVEATYFSDASCTQPVARPFGCESVGKYARVSAGPYPCDHSSFVYAIYETGAATTGQLYDSYGGQCSQSISDTYYPLVTLDPPSTFVAAQMSDVSIGDGLSVRVAQAADGAEQRLALIRDAVSKPCSPWPFAGGSTLCVDYDFALENGLAFVDSQCSGTTVAERLTPASCPPPDLVVKSVAGSLCDSQDLLYAAGAQVPTSQVYTSNGASCNPADASASYFALGNPVSAGAVPALTHIALGSGRVQVDYLATSSGTPLAPTGLFDSLKSVACDPYVAPDDQVRCIGLDQWGVQNGFADSQCTQALITYPWCPPSPSPAFGTNASDPLGSCPCFDISEACGKLTALQGLGAPYSGPIYTQWAGCSTTGATASGYLMGGALPSTDFAPLSSVVE